MTELADVTIEELQQELSGLGFKPSHAARILRSYYGAGGLSISEITD